jgi:hypothetical protein
VDWQARAIPHPASGRPVVPGGDEPEMLTEGPAADLMDQFGGTPATGLSRRSRHQLLVPGQGWLIAERDDWPALATADWGVYHGLRAGHGCHIQVRVPLRLAIWRRTTCRCASQPRTRAGLAGHQLGPGRHRSCAGST